MFVFGGVTCLPGHLRSHLRTDGPPRQEADGEVCELEDLYPAEEDGLTHDPEVHVDELVILGRVVFVQDTESGS